MHPRLILAGLEDHPQRQRLNIEFHAGPPVPLPGATLVSHLAFQQVDGGADAERQLLADLCTRLTCTGVDNTDACLTLETAAFRMRWERHTEFSSYTFFRALGPGEVLDTEATALDALHLDWMKQIPGKLMVATQIEMRSTAEQSPDMVLAGLADGRTMVAAQVADQAAWVFSDFRIHNGFSRFLVLNASMTQRQAGRTVQRLVEIETYRMFALLGLPVAKETGRWLYRNEQRLAELMDWIGRATTSQDERETLAAMSLLAAEVEHSVARTTFRFGASHAYQSMVMQRIEELRESRISGFPTFSEFMQRRLQPAMRTCAAISRRQEELSARVARNSQLLQTRVDVELQQQNQKLLGQMNQRAKLQLRLQETVEGLSVVVLTYYGSQLVHQIAKATAGLHRFAPETITAASIPLIAALVAWGTWRMRRMLATEH